MFRRRGRLTATGLVLALLFAAARSWRNRGADSGERRLGAPAFTDPSSAPAPRSPPEIETGERRGPYRVARVIDGDTIDVEIDGELRGKERIRLLRINTPERDQPGYERATAAMKALVEGQDVELVFEQPGKAATDDYGRLLAYVFLGELDVNAEMTRRGFTRFFTKYGEGRFAAEFRAAEEDARAKGAGLWTAEGWNVLAEEATPKKTRR